MGKVIVKIKLTNYFELELKRRKLCKDKPRSVETEALVDTGATRLYLQSSLIKALGLRKESEVQSKTTNGVRRRAVFESVRLELMGAERGVSSGGSGRRCAESPGPDSAGISRLRGGSPRPKTHRQPGARGKADERGVLTTCELQ